MSTLDARQSGKLGHNIVVEDWVSSMWLLYVSCAWVAGIFLGSKISPPWLAFALFVDALSAKFTGDIIDSRGVETNENQGGRFAAYINCEPFW